MSTYNDKVDFINFSFLNQVIDRHIEIKKENNDRT